MDDQPLVFEDWETVLKAEVPPERQRRYREAIVKFRFWLRGIAGDRQGITGDRQKVKKKLEIGHLYFFCCI